MSFHQDEISKLALKAARQELSHQKELQAQQLYTGALIVETAELNRDKAAVELRIQKTLEKHVEDAAKAAHLAPWTSSGKVSS